MSSEVEAPGLMTSYHPGGAAEGNTPGKGAEIIFNVQAGDVIVVRAEDGEPIIDGKAGLPGAGFHFYRDEQNRFIIEIESRWRKERRVALEAQMAREKP